MAFMYQAEQPCSYAMPDLIHAKPLANACLHSSQRIVGQLQATQIPSESITTPVCPTFQPKGRVPWFIMDIPWPGSRTRVGGESAWISGVQVLRGGIVQGSGCSCVSSVCCVAGRFDVEVEGTRTHTHAPIHLSVIHACALHNQALFWFPSLFFSVQTGCDIDRRS